MSSFRLYYRALRGIAQCGPLTAAHVALINVIFRDPDPGHGPVVVGT